MKITIDGELPALNEIIDKSKSHYMQYAKMKKMATNRVAWACNQLDIIDKVTLNSIELQITYYCKNRRKDPDNIAAGKKFILDGMVKAGVIGNDGWKEVKGWSEKWERDKDNPRIEVEIEEVVE